MDYSDECCVPVDYSIECLHSWIITISCWVKAMAEMGPWKGVGGGGGGGGVEERVGREWRLWRGGNAPALKFVHQGESMSGGGGGEEGGAEPKGEGGS